MPLSGRRHRLILYTYTLDRWWGTTLAIGIVLLALVAALTWLPTVLVGYTPPRVTGWIVWLAGGVGAFAVVLGLLLAILSRSAYIQPFADHLRLVTPFLRMNISYRRLNRATSAGMGQLFPPGEFKGRKREYLRPLSSHTAVVLEMKGWPLSRGALGLFLSPFFFPDKTSRLALLVPDWIQFSNELESFRSVWLDSLHHPSSAPQSDVLAGLSIKR